MNNKNITNFDYIIVIPGKTFSSQTVLSLIETTNYLRDINASFFISIRYIAIVSAVRNALIAQDLSSGYEQSKNIPKSLLPFGGKARAKKVIMIDSDITWTTQDFKLLIENNNDITMAPYGLVDGNTSIGLLEGYPLKSIDAKNYNEPFEIESGGLGFTAVNFEVFEKIGYPWFSTYEGLKPEELTGEDVFFCKRATEEGFKIICDPRIKPGHVKELTIYL
jgi:hypothetical protein